VLNSAVIAEMKQVVSSVLPIAALLRSSQLRSVNTACVPGPPLRKLPYSSDASGVRIRPAVTRNVNAKMA
jgi:hypothetical protein